jgi:hypothetical protein
MPAPKTVRINKADQIWIEDFSISATKVGCDAAQTMLNWVGQRKRPTRFIQAVNLLQAIIDGNMEKALDIILEVNPRLALRLNSNGFQIEQPMQPQVKRQTVETTIHNRTTETVTVEYEEPSSQDKLGGLMSSVSGARNLDI